MVACYDALDASDRVAASYLQAASATGPETPPLERQRYSTGMGSGTSDSGGSGSISSSAAKAALAALQPRTKDGRFAGSTPKPQPQLQPWLQQAQGLTAVEAGRYARLFAAEFGGDEAAALASLMREFKELRRRKLSGSDAAWAINAMASKRRASGTSIDGVLQVWQRLDDYISAYVQQRHQADKPERMRSSIAEMLRGRNIHAALAVAADPVEADALLAALCQRLAEAGSKAPEVDVGAILLRVPDIVWTAQDALLAVIQCAADELQPADLVAFLLLAPNLLQFKVTAVRQKLVQLQAAGLMAEQARQLAANTPRLLHLDLSAAREAAAWLRQLFPADKELWGVIESYPELLSVPVEQLQRTADVLQQKLGWDDARLADKIKRRPSVYKKARFDHPDTEAKVLFLTALGVDPLDCFGRYVDYLFRNLKTMVALYILVQERAPQLLTDAQGQPTLSGMKDKKRLLKACGLASAEYNDYLSKWPQSEAEQKVLADLRSGSTKSLPPMPVPPARSS